MLSINPISMNNMQQSTKQSQPSFKAALKVTPDALESAGDFFRRAVSKSEIENSISLLAKEIEKKTKDLPGKIILTNKVYGHQYYGTDRTNLCVQYKPNEAKTLTFAPYFDKAPARYITLDENNISKTADNILQDVKNASTQGKKLHTNY